MTDKEIIEALLKRDKQNKKDPEKDPENMNYKEENEKLKEKIAALEKGKEEEKKKRDSFLDNVKKALGLKKEVKEKTLEEQVNSFKKEVQEPPKQNKEKTSQPELHTNQPDLIAKLIKLQEAQLKAIADQNKKIEEIGRYAETDKLSKFLSSQGLTTQEEQEEFNEIYAKEMEGLPEGTEPDAEKMAEMVEEAKDTAAFRLKRKEKKKAANIHRKQLEQSRNALRGGHVIGVNEFEKMSLSQKADLQKTNPLLYESCKRAYLEKGGWRNASG